jgi:anaerobic selenocysteine-containing dehydrogenase
MLSVLVAENLLDRGFIAAHTQGWEALWTMLAGYTPEAVQEVCGLSVGRFEKRRSCSAARAASLACGAWA